MRRRKILRNLNLVETIHIDLYRYEDRYEGVRDLTREPFQVAIEGDYMIGAVLGHWRLYLFLDVIDGEHERIKIHKDTNEHVNISPDIVPYDQRDLVNDKFFHRYRQHENLFPDEAAHPLDMHVDVLHTLALCSQRTYFHNRRNQ